MHGFSRALCPGRETSFQKNKKARPYGQFVAVMDPKTRDKHARLHGKVFHLDDPFWDRFTPPLDFNCRCRKRALSKRDVARRGLKVLSGKGRMVRENQLVSKRTGETEPVTGYRLPGGGKIFPRAGFDNNQWKAQYQPNLDKHDYDIAKSYTQAAVKGPAFKRFFEGKSKGRFPIAVMNAETRALMPAAARGKQAVTIRYGKKGRRGTVAHVREHKNITQEDLLRAQEAVDDGMVIAPFSRKIERQFLLERGGFLWIFPTLGENLGMKTATFWKIPLGTKNYEEFLKTKLEGGKVLRKQKKKN